MMIRGTGEGSGPDGSGDTDPAVDLSNSHSIYDGSPIADLGGPLANAESRRQGHSSL